MDETRLDLRAADQERLEQWREAHRRNQRSVVEALRMGVGTYPITSRRGTIYRSSRDPATEELPVVQTSERDEEIMTVGTGFPEGKPTYEEALANALYHAQRATEESRTRNGRENGSMVAEAVTSRAWSAVAGLLREARTSAVAMYEQATAQRRERQRDYVQVPSPEAQRLIAEAGQTDLCTDAQKDGV